MYTIRTKSGMLFTSTEQNETYGKEVEYDTKAEADEHIEILKQSFSNEEFYVHEKNEVGRPAIGVTKKVSLTLSEGDWDLLDQAAEGNRSQFLRETVTKYLGGSKK